MSETTERSYYLVESMYFEKLLRTHFMLTQSTLLFEHLLSHSDRPMFLSARKVCEVLGIDRPYMDYINFLKEQKSIRAINQGCSRNEGYEKSIKNDVKIKK